MLFRSDSNHAYQNVKQFQVDSALNVKGDTLLRTDLFLGQQSALNAAASNHDGNVLNAAGSSTTDTNSASNDKDNRDSASAITSNDKLDTLLAHSGSLNSFATTRPDLPNINGGTNPTLIIDSGKQLTFSNGTWTNGTPADANGSGGTAPVQVQLGLAKSNGTVTNGNLYVGTGVKDSSGNYVDSAAKLDFGQGKLIINNGSVQVGHADAANRKILDAELDLSQSTIDTTGVNSDQKTIKFTALDQGTLKLSSEQLASFTNANPSSAPNTTTTPSRVATIIGAGGKVVVSGEVTLDQSRLVHDQAYGTTDELKKLAGKINFNGENKHQAALQADKFTLTNANQGIEIGANNQIVGTELNLQVGSSSTPGNGTPGTGTPGAGTPGSTAAAVQLNAGQYIAAQALTTNGSAINLGKEASLILGHVTVSKHTIADPSLPSTPEAYTSVVNTSDPNREVPSAAASLAQVPTYVVNAPTEATQLGKITTPINVGQDSTDNSAHLYVAAGNWQTQDINVNRGNIVVGSISMTNANDLSDPDAEQDELIYEYDPSGKTTNAIKADLSAQNVTISGNGTMTITRASSISRTQPPTMYAS